VVPRVERLGQPPFFHRELPGSTALLRHTLSNVERLLKSLFALSSAYSLSIGA
jgi:hypothetical protein